jgi:peroxiredoxin
MIRSPHHAVLNLWNFGSFSWLKRANVEDMPFQILSDPKLDWMKRYSAVAENDRWSMSILVFGTDGVIQALRREVEPSQASQLVTTILQSMKGQ